MIQSSFLPAVRGLLSLEGTVNKWVCARNRDRLTCSSWACLGSVKLVWNSYQPYNFKSLTPYSTVGLTEAKDGMQLLHSDSADYSPNMNVCAASEFCEVQPLLTPFNSEIWSRSHLQNPSTDVSAAGLTFHPVLGVVICLTVWHSIPATENKIKPL